jgi:hypothetical protein
MNTANNVIPMEQKLPNIVAGAKPQAIVPQNFEEAYRIANAVCKAGMAPRGLETSEKAMIAILHGLEVGLTPMNALQRIAVINGRPTIWGDGAIGLVRSSGLCEYVTEEITGTGDNRVAVCKTKRRGEPSAQIRTFSVSDAIAAGLWKKSGPWSQYPDRMLQMRARAFCLRDVYADVLGGLYLKEEIDDTHVDSGMRDVSPAPALQSLSPPSVAKAIEVQKIDAQPEQARDFDPEQFLKGFDDILATVQEPEQLQPLWDELVEPIWEQLNQPEQEEAQAIFNKHDKRLEP